MATNHPPPLMTTLYFLIFGSIIGRQIETIRGVDFITYITPGLIMMSLIMNSYLNVCSSFYTTKFQRSVEEILVSPTSSHAIIIGYITGGIFKIGMIIGTQSSFAWPVLFLILFSQILLFSLLFLC